MCCHVNMEIFEMEWPWTLVESKPNDRVAMCTVVATEGSCACSRASRGCCNERPSHAVFTRFVVVDGAGAGTQRTHHPNCIAHGFKAVPGECVQSNWSAFVLNEAELLMKQFGRFNKRFFFCRKKESNEMLKVLFCYVNVRIIIWLT